MAQEPKDAQSEEDEVGAGRKLRGGEAMGLGLDVVVVSELVQGLLDCPEAAQLLVETLKQK